MDILAPLRTSLKKTSILYKYSEGCNSKFLLNIEYDGCEGLEILACFNVNLVLILRFVQTLIHVRFESKPLRQSLNWTLVSRELVHGSSDFLLVALQVPKPLRLHLLELLVSALIQGNLLAHVRVETKVRVRREKSVQHGVNFWKQILSSC